MSWPGTKSECVVWRWCVFRLLHCHLLYCCTGVNPWCESFSSVCEGERYEYVCHTESVFVTVGEHVCTTCNKVVQINRLRY